MTNRILTGLSIFNSLAVETFLLLLGRPDRSTWPDVGTLDWFLPFLCRPVNRICSAWFHLVPYSRTARVPFAVEMRRNSFTAWSRVGCKAGHRGGAHVPKAEEKNPQIFRGHFLIFRFITVQIVASLVVIRKAESNKVQRRED